jgi:tetratricopeptide (TPR) repeat protein
VSQAIDIQMPLLLGAEEAAQGCERQAVFFRRDRECSACSGKGVVQARRCAPCEGTGVTYFPHRVDLALPPGLENQYRIRVKGLGGAAADGRTWGDLTFVCYVRSGEGAGSGSVPAVDNAVLAEAKTAAKQAMRRGDARQVLVELGIPGREGRLDGEAHALLGVAYANLGEKEHAAKHLYAALEQEPDNGGHHYNAGFFEAACGNRIAACLCYESALNRSPASGQARMALQQALAALWNAEARPLQITQSGLWALTEIGQAMSARQYVRAIALFGQVNLSGVSAEVRNTLQFLGGCAYLLACASRQSDSVEEAAALLYTCAASEPAREVFQHGLVALEHFLRYDCDLDGLLAFAAYQAAARRPGRAGEVLVRAVAAAQAYTPPQASMVVVDPLVRAKQASVLKRFETLRLTLKTFPPAQAEEMWLRGLAELVEAYYQVAVSGQIEPGWSHAVHAVQLLESAVVQSPLEPTKRNLFFQAVDYSSHLAEALLKQTDSGLYMLLQNTEEALRASAIPNLPLSKLLRSDETRKELRDLVRAVSRPLLKAAEEPLRGEFVAAARIGYYVLTNYRLLLMWERLPQMHLLPLSVIQRYSPRAEGMQTTTLVFGYRDGRQLALNRVANGSFPPAELMEYLLSARLWEVLPEADRTRLEAGFAEEEARTGSLHRYEVLLPDLAVIATAGRTTTAAPAPPPARPAACTRCGRVSGSQDLFCRQCGAPLGDEGSSPPTPTGS